MDKVYQTIFQDEKNTGNCLQACIATLFGLPLEEVPHFATMGDYWFQNLIKWGLGHGILTMMLDGYPPSEIYTIMGGPSPRGNFTHAVVVGPNNEVVHDPHPSGDGLAPGDRWFYLFIPVKQSTLRDFNDKQKELV